MAGEVAIRVEELAKRYRIGELQANYGTLRDSLIGAITATTRRSGRSTGSRSSCVRARCSG